MTENVALGYGVSGWKARQERAKQKNSARRNPEERARIRAARKRLHEQQAKESEFQQEKESPASEPRTPVEGSAVSGDEPKESPGVEVPRVGENPEFAKGGGTFDLSGNWMAKRAEVKEVLGLDKAPASKAAAKELLVNAGYEVTE